MNDRWSNLKSVHTVLLTLTVSAAFWSSALTEVSASLCILWSLATNVSQPGLFMIGLRRLSPVHRAMLVCWTAYVAAVALSFPLTGTRISVHPGLIWHPLMFLAVMLSTRHRNDLSRIITALFVSGTVATVVSFARTMHAASDQPLPTFVGLTTFADLAALAAIAAGSFVVMSRRGIIVRLAVIASGFVVVLGTFASSERAPAAVLVTAGVLLAASIPSRMKYLWIVILAVAFLFSPFILLLKFDWLAVGTRPDRVIVWNAGLDLLRHVPLFGYGPESYERILPADVWTSFPNKPPGSWHNDYLQTALDSGPLAAAALVALVALVLNEAVKNVWRERKRSEGLVATPLFLMLVGLAGFAFVGGVITTTVLGLVFWMLAGLAVQSGPGAEEGESEEGGVRLNSPSP